ncbi:3-hydroxy-3-methylglutaryl-coenzyme A reductase [Lutibacter oricola]|uniref:3-hydroxy-3-methylglutaryl coenzyme A reductase n=1 Tax=Lutibacter oricola TaxID=762486 RepID=A0A1H2U7D3_9FLAO|nr:hydroxymethylglutaryl-CoA reductase, degradative [Lutibacter oricola]SDW52061.1 3-hydroxy-3-methylglutaryl-coenzyme A reductase [Lutibacter oricola]
MSKTVNGFSKLNKFEKIDWLIENFFNGDNEAKNTLSQYWNENEIIQDLHDDFIENTISNYYLPFGIAPNFVINGKDYVVPMAIEESSVVAAASLVAKFWSTRGGFKAEVLSTVKIGQVHFMYEGDKAELQKYFNTKKEDLLKATSAITKNMRKRGGGILDVELRDKTEELENYYQLHVTFETVDSMGANFINSCLEAMANEFENENIRVVMSILSNYVPECLVKAEVSCKVEELYAENSEYLAQKFVEAVQIANVEPHRAVTHNKGIMNGIDAVVIATGNDFRAIESCAHAYSAKDGQYRSLSNATIENGIFKFWIEIPLALGTVGGLTSLHPLSKLAMQMLGKPSAKELMQIIAVAGLAQNFAALRALTTTGIQKGHMKMHLTNIIKGLGASEADKQFLINYFENKTVTHNAVVEAYNNLRK